MSQSWTKARVLKHHSDGSATYRIAPLVSGKHPAPETMVLVKIRQPRNIRHHNLYWSLLAVVVHATGRWPTVDACHTWMKWRLNMYRPVAVADGEVVLEWQSTDFAAMDQVRFNAFFKDAIYAISLETGIDPEALRTQVDEAS